MALDISYRPPNNRRGGAHILHVPVTVGTITANQTNPFSIPIKETVALVGASVICHTVGADADGTLVLTVCKRLGTDNTRVALTSALNIETLTTLKTTTLTLATGLTPAQRTCIESRLDSIYVEVVSNSAAIDTQPTNLVVMLELALKK